MSFRNHVVTAWCGPGLALTFLLCERKAQTYFALPCQRLLTDPRSETDAVFVGIPIGDNAHIVLWVHGNFVSQKTRESNIHGTPFSQARPMRNSGSIRTSIPAVTVHTVGQVSVITIRC